MSGTTTTDNGAMSNATTGSARLDLFFKAVRSLADDDDLLARLLTASWDEDALDTLKIIFQARDCRGGKGEKKLFARSLIWLSKHHPESLRKNLKHIPYFGSWKDYLVFMPTPFADQVLHLFADQLREDLQKIKNYKPPTNNNSTENTQQETTTNNNEQQETSKTENETTKDKKDQEKPKITKERPPLPFISLAAKWAPSENHGNDKKTGSSIKLAILLAENPKTSLRDYRKNYLVPLRAHLKVIETFVSAKKWEEIPYSLVPSRSMNLHKKQFLKYDKERFNAYLQSVSEGTTTIKGNQMLPHELVGQCLNSTNVDEVVELQWKVIVEETKKLGSLAGSIVLSDVSGSMEGFPMLVSIGLGLLISEITAPPFTNCVVTFHSNPTFHVVTGDTLHARAASLRGASWGGSTNFQAVFDLILYKSIENNVPPEHMPKRLFVISDMQFDVADKNYKSNFERVKQKYKEAGYDMPQMVFWNVKGRSIDFPVTHEEIGVAMVSGFSASILKGLLKAGEFATPWEVLRSIIDGPRYKILEV